MLKYNVQSPYTRMFSPYIDSYVEITGEKNISKTITPRLTTTLVFDLNDHSLCNGYGFATTVIGHHNAPFHLSTRSESQHKLMVQFTAYGLSPFIKTPLSGINNSVIDANKLFGNDMKVLHGLLRKTHKFEDQIQLIESFLIRRFRTPSPSHRLIYQLADSLVKTNTTDVRELKDTIPLSTRQIERNFRKLTGLTISQFMKVRRFEKAQKLINTTNKGINKFTDIAYQAGYYDQAHFNSDFKELTGSNPRNYRFC